jgi:hypothetical protein
MATVRPAAAIAARDVFLRVATKTGMVDRKMAPTLNQLDVAYPAVPGLTDPAPGRWRRPARAVGRRVPDVALTGPGGDTRLFELLAGHPLTLLAACTAAGDLASVAALAAELRDRPYADLVAVHQIGQGMPSGSGLSDPAGALHRHLGARRKGVLALVRADQHVTGVAPLADPAGMLRLLDGLLRPPATGAAGPAAGAADAAVPAGAEDIGGFAAPAPTTITRGDAP